MIVVNYQDESHLHSFAAQQKASAVDALGGTSFYVLPAEVVQFGVFSVHFQVDDGPLFSVKAMPPLRTHVLSKHEKELFKKLQAALECIRIPVSEVLEVKTLNLREQHCRKRRRRPAARLPAPAQSRRAQRRDYRRSR